MAKSCVLAKKAISNGCGGGWFCMVHMICGIEDDETWGVVGGKTHGVNSKSPGIPSSLGGL